MDRFTLWLALVLMLFVNRVSAVDVAVTIKPLHSITAAVMKDVSEPALLLDGRVSPHIDRLKPSVLKKMRTADLFIWIGPGLESFLTPAVEELPSTVNVLTASAQMLPSVLALRDSHSDADTALVDPHLWLDPVNAAALAERLAEQLGELDPANADTYLQNARIFANQMDTLTQMAMHRLAESNGVPFILFHDFTQYLEQRFALNNVGVVTYQPQVVASARHIMALNRVIKERDVTCVLTEPQFQDRALRSLSRSSGFQYAVVDPLASRYDTGPQMYEAWFTDLIGDLNTCLAAR